MNRKMNTEHPVGNKDYTQSTVVIVGAGISGSSLSPGLSIYLNGVERGKLTARL